MEFKTSDIITVGSRKSELALIQTNHVIDLLKQHHHGREFKIFSMSTKGDKILNKALPKIGEKSLFTQELEDALAKKEVSLVVHSLKDMPTTLKEDMVIGAILEREDPRDAVVMAKKYSHLKSLEELPEGSVIGTSSLRRCAYLARNMKHLKVETIRGNLNTRLAKLDDENGPFAAIILAVSGLKRMGREARISQILDSEDNMYAVGQGALAVECRESDFEVLSLLEPLAHRNTTLQCVCERSFLKTLGGGCSAPVAVKSKLIDKELEISGAVLSLNGDVLITNTLKSELYLPKESTEDGEPVKKCPYREPRTYISVVPGKISDFSLLGAEKLGKDLAESLIKKDALTVMAEARKEVLKS